MKKSKLSFFLLPLLIFPAFFLFVFSPSHSAFSGGPNPSSAKVKQGVDDDWLKKPTNDLYILLNNLLYGVQQLKVIEGDKEYTYPVDLLATAITQLMLKQKKRLREVDLNELKGSPRQQLLDLLDAQGKLKHRGEFNRDVQEQISNRLGEEYFESIKPLLIKMWTWGIRKISHSSSDLSVWFPEWSKISIKTLKGLTRKKLYDIMYAPDSDPTLFYLASSVLTQLPINFGLEVKTALTSSVDKILSSFLHILQKARGLGLTHITVNKKKTDVAALISCLTGLTDSKSRKRKSEEQIFLSSLKGEVQTWINSQIILAFQKNWDGGQVSNYLLWLPIFDIKEVKLIQDEVLPVDLLATAIETMLNAEKFDFTKLEGEVRKQLLDLLDSQGKFKKEKTFQDDVWRQIKNHQKWKTIEGLPGQLILQLIRILLFKVQDLGISKVSHSFFLEGYDLSFLQDGTDWKQISFENLLQGITVKINDTYVEFYSHLFPNQVVFQVPMKKLSTVFSGITIANIIIALERAISVQEDLDTKKILAFQKNWNEEKVSSYLLWLPVFDIKEVKLSQNKAVPVDALAVAIKTMLTAEKFDFTKLEGKARKQLLNLLNNEGKLRAGKTFQDDVWRQIKNHQKWKKIEGPAGKLSLQLIKILLIKIQDLGISKVSHSFFPEGYDLSFLKDDESWKEISFQELLQGMKVVVNGINVEFYSHLFPNKIVFQVPMKKLSTVFSGITITNIIKALEKAINDHPQQEKKLATKNKGLIIGLSVAGSFLVLAVLGGFLYWFFKVKK